MSPTTIRRTSAVAFGAVAFALAVISTLAFRTVHRSARANRLVAHTYEVLSALEAVRASTVQVDRTERAAIGQRALDPNALQRVEASVGSSIDAVAGLTADDPVQQRHVVELRNQANVALHLVQASDTSRQLTPAEKTDGEWASVEAMRATLQQMRVEEELLMASRLRTAAGADVQTREWMNGIIAAAFGILAISFLFTIRRAVQLDQLNASLASRVHERTSELEAVFARERQARAEADAANASKDLFLAQVSHELRTPLNALHGWARMLRDGQVEPERVEHAIAAIDRNGGVLTTLVEDLLEMSRITAGRLELNRRHVDIAALAHDALGLLEPAAQAKRIALEIDVESQPVIVDGDATRLRQVVWNLISNAVKFTPASGRVTLRVSSTTEEAEIDVVDTGEGIAAEFLPHVFEPFSQADHGGRGLGLGLAIVHQLVTAHGGRIVVASPGIGAGATFTVTLPLARLTEPA